MIYSLKEFLKIYPGSSPALDKEGNKITSFDGSVLYQIPKSSYDKQKEKEDEFFKAQKGK